MKLFHEADNWRGQTDLSLLMCNKPGNQLKRAKTYDHGVYMLKCLFTSQNDELLL